MLYACTPSRRRPTPGAHTWRPHVLLLLGLLAAASLPRACRAQQCGGACKSACSGKSTGASCSFTIGGGAKAGQSVSGACSSAGECAAASTPCGTAEKSCPTSGQYQGVSACSSATKPAAAPLRGSLGCVDAGPLATRPTVTSRIGGAQAAANIYGPMEAGFTKAQPAWSCLGDSSVAAGHDTKVAEAIGSKVCGTSVSVLDSCGGHAVPYHYHEKLSCLYSNVSSGSLAGHSTRVGTALDGNGIYGHHVAGGKLPCDLDACGGRTGVTPDSSGASVYYYMITSFAPFTLGCFGKKDHVTTVAECRALYKECDNVLVDVVTASGTSKYDLDCPCYDKYGSNVKDASAVPAYMTAGSKALVPATRCVSTKAPTSAGQTWAPTAATKQPTKQPTKTPTKQPTKQPTGAPTTRSPSYVVSSQDTSAAPARHAPLRAAAAAAAALALLLDLARA